MSYIMLNYTDPRLFLYDAQTLYLYVIDDFGNTVQIPSNVWYSALYSFLAF